MTILSVADLREHINSDLGDDALGRLLADAEAAIVQRAGAAGDRTQIAGGGYRFIALHRPASAVTSITETVGDTDTTLAVDDYLLRPGGYLVERLLYGTNSRSSWDRRVAIVYTPVDDAAIRIGVQIDLVKLALTYSPGLTSETIGEWSESFANGANWNNDEEREAILCRLDAESSMVVVGNSG